MEELLRLLGIVEGGDLSGQDLDQLLADIRTEAQTLLDAEDPTDEDLEVLGRVATAVQTVEQAIDERDSAAEERRNQQAQRRAQILGQGEGEGEGDDGGEGEGEGEGAESEGGEGDGATSTEGDGEVPVVEDAEPQPIAANAAPRTRVTRAAARRPAGMDPRDRRTRQQQLERQHEPLQIVAAANLPNVAAGSPLDTPAALAQAFMSAHKASMGYRGPRTKIVVARVGSELAARDLYGSERFLSRDHQRNQQLIDAVITPDAVRFESLQAAGGICAPIGVNYDMPTVGTDDRPVRDRMLTRFGADRGGVATFPPPTLADVDGAVDVWTEANDQNPTSPATKPCLTLTCPNEETTLVEAITRCFEIGNFRARYWQEQVQAWVDLGAILHARTAETELLTAVGAGSTQVTSGQVLGAATDVLTTLGRAVAQIRNRHRMPRNGPALVFGAPEYLLDIMREDIARQINGTGTYDEKLALADAAIEAWLRVRHVVPTWFLDGETGQIHGAQGDGPLIGWPSTIVTYLYPAGSWLFLDGGELDLGIVRDSTLNSTNDYQMFYESFEGAHYHGIESYRLTMDLCPDGTVSGTADIAVCDTGS